MFDSSFFTGNRLRLSESLPNTLIVIAANSLLQSSVDLAFPFKQDSNFWYLCGMSEPDYLLVMDTDEGSSTILTPELNEYQLEWDWQISTEIIKQQSGIENFGTIDSIDEILKAAKSRGLEIAVVGAPPERVEPYGFYSNPARRNLIDKITSILDCKTEVIKDVRLEIARLRQVKQACEIKAIQKAIDITGNSMQEVKRNLKSFSNEKHVERFLSAEFYRNGSDGHGFEPIIASGKNASIIHSNRNIGNIHKNDLILLDVGAELDNYTADISRTWALGKPSKRQKELYNAVLEIQEIGFSMLKPGVYLKNFQKELELKTRKILKKLNCSTADDPFPHGFSHFLGIDVHDAGDYELPLAENMVITIEPGIYLSDEGIGIRIEDNVRITKTGIVVMSNAIPRDL